jgi:uncharacterized Zn-finger protein
MKWISQPGSLPVSQPFLSPISSNIPLSANLSSDSFSCKNDTSHFESNILSELSYCSQLPHPQRPTRPGRPRSSSSPKNVFICEVCQSSFVRRHDLKRHALIHLGVKPFQCECGRFFSRQDALHRHMAVKKCEKSKMISLTREDGNWVQSAFQSIKRGRAQTNLL